MLHRTSQDLWSIRTKYYILFSFTLILIASVDAKTTSICENPGFQEDELGLHCTKRDSAQFTQVFSKGKPKLSDAKKVENNIDEFERLRLRDLSSLKQFPSEEICPYLSIRSKSAENSTDDENTCQTGKVNESECEFIHKYVGRPRAVSPKSCRSAETKPLCWFGQDYRNSSEDLAGLQCSTQPCQPSPVYLGIFNTSFGQVLPDDHWASFSMEEDLEEAISRTMTMEGAEHFRFCFLRCSINQELNKTLRQILIFPPIVEKSSNSALGININIVVEDAVSRAHFYRSLPKTVNALRDVLHDSSVSATVLDFEKYQSYDSSTHSNIRRLFAGATDATITGGIKEMYQNYKEAGYRTMFQEDVCWFDGLGSLLRPRGSAKDDDDPPSPWEQFRRGLLNAHVQRPFLDTFGVGFSACKILQDLGDTNIFNGENLPALCFDGRHLSWYFLKTTRDFLDLSRKTGSPPAFSYVHLNTGHEHTGTRIVNDDENLASFVTDMAAHTNTLTIILSDHGAKTSEYATRTAPGLKETYKPFLFMIIPQRVAEFLGNERMKNLIKNQKRLVALEDLNLALQDLVARHSRKNPQTRPDFNKSDTTGGKSRGLFSELSANRSCSDFKLSSDAVCLCEDEEVPVELDEFFLDFMANIAVGEINNLIQLQHTKAGKTGIVDEPSAVAGYGRCRRYALRRVERVRSKVRGENRFTTFTAVLEAAPAIDGNDEAFEVTLSYPLAATHGFSVVKITRTSRYSVFKSCADPNVEPYLCTCDRAVSKKTLVMNSDYIWQLFGYYMFSRFSSIRKLYGSCLFAIKTQLERTLRNGDGRDATMLHEVINVCDNKLFNLTVTEESLVRKPFLLSRPLPFTIAVYPNTMHYVIGAFCGLPDGEFAANFKVDVTDLA